MISDDWSAPVVVPWEEGAKLCAEAQEQAQGAGLERSLLRKLQRFTVSVPEERNFTTRYCTKKYSSDSRRTPCLCFPSNIEAYISARYGLQLNADFEGIADIETLS